jgi:excisionase family DNA binding protein
VTLRDLVADLERRAILADAEGATAPVGNVYRLVLAELVPLAANGHSRPPCAAPAADLLTVEDAARRLGVSPGWLYRRSKRLPFMRKLGPKTLRCDAEALDAWKARRAP